MPLYTRLSHAAFACLLSASAALAWGPAGHRITAEVAQGNLDAATLSAVQDIAGTRSLALIATWPDYVRSFPVYDCLKPMHFLTVEDGQSVTNAMQVPPSLSDACDKVVFESTGMPGNVVDAIRFFAGILQGDTDKARRFEAMMTAQGADMLAGSTPLTALALLVHFTGDVHQPLHVGRGPDRGGNTITVQWFDQELNFHEVWDEELIAREGLSFTEFTRFLDEELGRAAPVPSDPVAWAQESVDARGQVYDWGGSAAYNVPKLSYAYAAAQNDLLKARLHKGGMRLAATLASIFGP